MQIMLNLETTDPDKQVLRNAKAIIESNPGIWMIQAITDATDAYCTDHNLINPQWEYYDKRGKRIRSDISRPAGYRLAKAMNYAAPTENKSMWDFMKAVEAYDKDHSLDERLSLIEEAINL